MEQEGELGLLHFLSFCLRGSASSDPESLEVKRLQRLREEVLMLKREEANLDKSFEMAQGVLRSMSEDDYNKRLSYLTHTDIRNIPSFSDETLLAVKAPYGSTLEVPDPDEVKQKKTCLLAYVCA